MKNIYTVQNKTEMYMRALKNETGMTEKLTKPAQIHGLRHSDKSVRGIN